jgi:hypothetical protein
MHRGPDAFLDQVVGGRWRLVEVLGATEHGAVFRVEALQDGRPARLELWDQRHVERRGELARFEREARNLSRLTHERCLPVVAFGSHEGRPFLVSDLPEGKTLREATGQSELAATRAVSLGLQLCEGLQHLHRHGVVHRALLPENVWVARSTAGDLLKIGLPRISYTSERSTTRLDHRTDLHAAGLLLYMMCTGREPPTDAPPAIDATASGEGLERVILRALAPSPDVRFQTADDLMAALQAAGVRPASPKRRPAQRPRMRTAMVTAAFATVALLGVGALRSGGGQGPSAPPAAHAAPPPPPPSVPVKVAVVEPPAVPPAPIAAPPVAPPPAPVELPRKAAAAAAPPAMPDDHSQIWSLLDSGRLDEGGTRIKALVARDPDAAWPRFALGVLYYRRYWRRDSVRQWQQALEQDRQIRHDPQFGAYLCFMLDDTWQAAGVKDLLDQLGTEAVPLLENCVASAKSAQLRSSASRALDRLRAGHHRSRRRL